MFTDPRYLNSIVGHVQVCPHQRPGITLGPGAGVDPVSGLRGINFFRTVYFMPSVMPMVAVSLTWFYVLRPETGPLAGLLRCWD